MRQSDGLIVDGEGVVFDSQHGKLLKKSHFRQAGTEVDVRVRRGVSHVQAEQPSVRAVVPAAVISDAIIGVGAAIEIIARRSVALSAVDRLRDDDASGQQRGVERHRIAVSRGRTLVGVDVAGGKIIGRGVARHVVLPAPPGAAVALDPIDHLPDVAPETDNAAPGSLRDIRCIDIGCARRGHAALTDERLHVQPAQFDAGEHLDGGKVVITPQAEPRHTASVAGVGFGTRRGEVNVYARQHAGYGLQLTAGRAGLVLADPDLVELYPARANEGGMHRES